MSARFGRLLRLANAKGVEGNNQASSTKAKSHPQFKPNEKIGFEIPVEGRELIYNIHLQQSPIGPPEITALVFDQTLLLVRVERHGNDEEAKVLRRPIPLYLLAIRETENVTPTHAVTRGASILSLPTRTNPQESKPEEAWPITFCRLGKAGYQLTLYATDQGARDRWLDFIASTRQCLHPKVHFVTTATISSNFLGGDRQINCITSYDGGRKILFATQTGIYVVESNTVDQAPRQILETANVAQIGVLEELQLLLVLSNKRLECYSLSALISDKLASSQTLQRIQDRCSFFTAGICLGRHLICCVNSSAFSTNVTLFEPRGATAEPDKQEDGAEFAAGGRTKLKLFKEFYIPAKSSSAYILPSEVCVVGVTCFYLVSLDTLELKTLPDQLDTSFNFITRKPKARPMHIAYLDEGFLLSYSKYSLFVNRNGQPARLEWRIDWNDFPESFALVYPWIMAFQPNFIELRNCEDGACQTIPYKNIRMFQSSPKILFLYETDRGETVAATNNF